MTNLSEDLGIIRRRFNQDKLAALHSIVCRGGEPHEWGHASWVERQMLWLMWSEIAGLSPCAYYTEANMRAFSKYLREEVIEIPF